MNRRGAMLLETIVAGIVLGMLLTVSLQLLSAASAQRRAADQRRCAIRELDNIMERVTARPWTELTDALAKQEKLSSAAVQELPDAELKLEIVAEAKESNAKRITASLRWRDRADNFIVPLQLTTWRYKTEN